MHVLASSFPFFWQLPCRWSRCSLERCAPCQVRCYETWPVFCHHLDVWIQTRLCQSRCCWVFSAHQFRHRAQTWKLEKTPEKWNYKSKKTEVRHWHLYWVDGWHNLDRVDNVDAGHLAKSLLNSSRIVKFHWSTQVLTILVRKRFNS